MILPSAIESSFINQGLYRLHSLKRTALDAQTIPILAVHGWLDNVASFLPLMVELPGLPWFAIDLVGHGRSEWRSSASYYFFSEYLCDLILLIEECFPQGVHLLGHSLGGAIVSMVAGIMPDKVKSLTMIDVLGPLTSPVETVAEQCRLAVHQYRNLKEKRLYPSLEIMATARRKRHNISPLSCQLLVEYGSLQVEQGYQWSFDPKLFHLSPMQMSQEQVLSVLDTVRMPTMMIKAIEGYNMQPEILEPRKAKIPQLEYIEIKGGHHVHMDDPQLVAECLLKFYHKHGFFD